MKKTHVSGILAMLLCCTMLMSGCGKTDVPPQTTDPAQAGNELSGAAAIKPEGYPKGGTVTVVCGYNAGGAQDNNCRVAAQYASVLSGDNYVVTNIAGSGGRGGAGRTVQGPGRSRAAGGRRICAAYAGRAHAAVHHPRGGRRGAAGRAGVPPAGGGGTAGRTIRKGPKP